MLGVEFSVPDTAVAPGMEMADEMTGKFCNPLGPASPSPASFGVGPSALRSMAGAPHAMNRFRRRSDEAAPVTRIGWVIWTKLLSVQITFALMETPPGLCPTKFETIETPEAEATTQVPFP